MLDRDMMNMASVRESAAATMRVIDSVQDLPPHLQVIGITATFKLLAERFNMSVADAFTVADNIMNHAEGRRVEFDAVRDYLANEV